MSITIVTDEIREQQEFSQWLYANRLNLSADTRDADLRAAFKAGWINGRMDLIIVAVTNDAADRVAPAEQTHLCPATENHLRYIAKADCPNCRRP